MVKKTNVSFNLKKLCTPAFIYFLISVFGLFAIGIQNLNGSNDTLCLGVYKCSVVNKTVIFLMNALYILFWTFVLDLFCKTGYSNLSWFIVFIPIILSFIFAGIIVYQTQM
jgi:hypothetical protein